MRNVGTAAGPWGVRVAFTAPVMVAGEREAVEGLSASGRHGRWRPGTSQGETADAEAECQQSWTEQVDLNGDVTRTEPSGNLSLSVPSSVLPLHGAVGPASVRVP